MKQGDLVTIEMYPIRKAGIILKKLGSDHPHCLYMVMTASGRMLWLQKKRLRVISETQTR